MPPLQIRLLKLFETVRQAPEQRPGFFFALQSVLEATEEEAR